MAWSDEAPKFQVNSVEIPRLVSLQELDADDETFLTSMIDLYLESSAKALNQLQTSVAKHDRENICASSHLLKSSSANLGARKLAQLCEHLETQSDPDNGPGKPNFTDDLKLIQNEYLQVDRDLKVTKCLILGEAVPDSLKNPRNMS